MFLLKSVRNVPKMDYLAKFSIIPRILDNQLNDLSIILLIPILVDPVLFALIAILLLSILFLCGQAHSLRKSHVGLGIRKYHLINLAILEVTYLIIKGHVIRIGALQQFNLLVLNKIIKWFDLNILELFVKRNELCRNILNIILKHFVFSNIILGLS